MPNCYKCKLELEESCFAKNSTLKSGIQNICKQCSRKLNKEYYIKNKQKFLDRNKIKVKDVTSKVREYKLNCGGCKFCGEKEPICLDFHHLRDKINVISQLTRYLCWESILEEINKCILICSNCHRKLHAGLISYQESELVSHED